MDQTPLWEMMAPHPLGWRFDSSRSRRMSSTAVLIRRKRSGFAAVQATGLRGAACGDEDEPV